MEREEIQKRLKKELDKNRYEHTLGVMYTAGSLAMAYGYDYEKAMIAGLLHDCAKCLPTEKKISLCEKNDILISKVERENPGLLHAKAGMVLAEYAFTGMRLYVIGFLFAGFNIIGTGYLSASEHAKEAFTASVCRGFVAIAVCSVILSRMFGIRGVWLSFMAAEALTAGITAWALLKDHKKEAMA